MKRKQFTIIMRGNRFGEYLTNGLSDDGFYTKWRVKYHYYPEYEEYKEMEVKSLEASMTSSDISEKLLERTKDWYDAIHMANGDYPYWLEQLEKEVKGVE